MNNAWYTKICGVSERPLSHPSHRLLLIIGIQTGNLPIMPPVCKEVCMESHIGFIRTLHPKFLWETPENEYFSCVLVTTTSCILDTESNSAAGDTLNVLWCNSAQNWYHYCAYSWPFMLNAQIDPCPNDLYSHTRTNGVQIWLPKYNGGLFQKFIIVHVFNVNHDISNMTWSVIHEYWLCCS